MVWLPRWITWTRSQLCVIDLMVFCISLQFAALNNLPVFFVVFCDEYDVFLQTGPQNLFTTAQCSDTKTVFIFLLNSGFSNRPLGPTTCKPTTYTICPQKPLRSCSSEVFGNSANRQHCYRACARGRGFDKAPFIV